ncbi:MAG: hypothetical protein DLM53_03320 [Candidatus Eremiobacter antarcticus]|nr:hypothetical protein [Candidatus Eremiobacteraeota bacterium]MBC5809217.1 hypothetical protein [Candidatus Eremiobacteraeota bacterium]PZR63803.1 MAG: hypothetical protein DLM53_03320 [Candidatus Eremiobacter sp. RRmetagenome_bin22]
MEHYFSRPYAAVKPASSWWLAAAVLTAVAAMALWGLTRLKAAAPDPTLIPPPTAVALAALPADNSKAPRHVLTADYVATKNATKVSPDVLGPWLSWASTTWQVNRSVVAAGIKTMLYTDPNRQQPRDPMFTNDESAYAHTCSGSRITSTAYENQYLTDPSSGALRDIWRRHVATRSAGAHWDAIFDDDANDIDYATGVPCNYSPSAWLSATKAEIESFGLPVVYNGLHLESQMKLNDVRNVIGGMEEGCYADSSKVPKTYDQAWEKTENIELEMGRQHKLFFCLGRDSSDASAALDGRLYVYASFLLAYSLPSSVLWELYDTPSRFHVQPESKLVVMGPTPSSITAISELKTSAGVYAREYSRCYLSGAFLGACAVVVNPDRYRAHDFPYAGKYKRTLVLSGGGIIDGGQAAPSGPSPPSTLAPLSATIAFQ